MKETGLDFNKYVLLTCKYAYLEYEFGIDSPAALFYLNQNAIDHLNACWLSCVPIPDAANSIAKMVQKEE
jgi:hypothetical protein